MDETQRKVKEGIIDDTEAYYPPDYKSGDPDKLLKEGGRFSTVKLIYPACFYPCEEGGYTVVFPDLPGCITEGDTLAEAVDMAIEAVSGWLLEEVENQKPIPQATYIKSIVADEYENGFVSLISVDLDEYSRKHSSKAVKKTLTIPAWLNTIAEKENTNFSQVLQSALKEHLGIHDRS